MRTRPPEDSVFTSPSPTGLADDSAFSRTTFNSSSAGAATIVTRPLLFWTTISTRPPPAASSFSNACADALTAPAKHTTASTLKTHKNLMKCRGTHARGAVRVAALR
jgi:hypothetical protein